MEDGHAKTVEEVLNNFGTDIERGLSGDQVKRNQEKYGPNGKHMKILNQTNLLRRLNRKYLIVKRATNNTKCPLSK